MKTQEMEFELKLENVEISEGNGKRIRFTLSTTKIPSLSNKFDNGKVEMETYEINQLPNLIRALIILRENSPTNT